MRSRYQVYRHLLVLLALGVAYTACRAQQVTKVYPSYAVAGTEVRFTATGSGFPADKPAALGMKFSFGRPGECIGASRYQPLTQRAYHFACTLRPGMDAGNLPLLLFNRKRAQHDTPLWRGLIQILPAAPTVDSVTLIGPQQSAQTSVNCDARRVCLTLVGDLLQGQRAIAEVRGNNLPSSLTLRIAGCADSSAPTDAQDTAMRIFVCTPGKAGEHRIQVLTAPEDQGGTEILSGTVAVL